MVFNSVPGINRWRGGEPDSGRPKVGARRGPPQDYKEIKSKKGERGLGIGAVPGCPSYLPMNADPAMLPDRTGVYFQAKRSSGAAVQHGGTEASTQLGCAISRGYGRVPTAFVYTSADTLLSTTEYQSPTKAGAGHRLAAFTFCGGGGSSSAPASPLDRTLLYSRAPAAMGQQHQQQQQQQRGVAAIDLLDRMTLLRRLGPTTDLAARPQLSQRRAAPQHFTPAPPRAAVTHPWQQQPHHHHHHQQRWVEAGAALAMPGALAASGCRRWAWDDSLVGMHSSSLGGGGSLAPARPIAAVPAPGWRYCGDSSAVQTDVRVAVADQHRRGNALGVFVSSGRGGAVGPGEQQEDVCVVVHSPRAHHMHPAEGWAEDEADAAAHTAGGASGSGGRRVAFRPPGPLQHKFGNKPRPRSAPSAAERAHAAGLRDCGCPRSPRASASGGLGSGGGSGARVSSVSGPARKALATSSRQLDCGQQATAAVAAAPQLPSRPCSAAPGTRQQQRDSSTETEAAIPAGQPQRQQRQGRGSNTRMDVAVAEGGTHGGSTVAVAAECDTDIIVISSPRASSGLGASRRSQHDVVVVSSPRAGGGHGGRGGSTDLIVVHHHEEVMTHHDHGLPTNQAAHRPRRPASASQGAHSKLTVSVPAGHGTGYTIWADATGGSPSIAAWRRPPAGSPPPPPPRQAPGKLHAEVIRVSPLQSRQQAVDLQQLTSEIKRREQSFQQLLEELDRITAKCSKLTANSQAEVPAARAAGASPVRTAAPPPPRTRAHPHSSVATAAAGGGDGATLREAGVAGGGASATLGRSRQHTTHWFGSAGAGTGSRVAAEQHGSRRGQQQQVADGGSRGSTVDDAIPQAATTGAVAGVAVAGCSGRQDESEWSWESLLAFEQTIREQQRKLVEQGVLPPEYA